MPNVITSIGDRSSNIIVVRSDNKTIVNGNGNNTIKMIVRSNERGPKGENGRDGFVQYTAGPGIFISNKNVISATGGGGSGGVWGAILGDIQDQTDLQEEFGEYTKTTDLATVATSGSYNDLSNKPSLSTVATSGNYSDLSGRPSLATVATSGSYNDLSNKPTKLSDFTYDIINKIYPVGSIYMSATLSTPAQVAGALGGTWAAWGSGKVPVGVDTSDTDFNTAEKTGGEKTHTLTEDEIPRHRHYAGVRWSTEPGASYMYGSNGAGTGAEYDSVQGFTGGNQSHNNLQPYITCYMYKRTA